MAGGCVGKQGGGREDGVLRGSEEHQKQSEGSGFGVVIKTVDRG